MMLENKVIDCANNNNGIVTVMDMKRFGFNESSLRQYVRRHPDMFNKRGSGVYEVIDDRVSVDPRDAAYASALALAGEGAYLTGSSVLDFYNLANANPVQTTVKTPHHISKRLPSWLHVVTVREKHPVDIVRGIRLQNLFDAFREAKDTRLDYRFDAISDAEQRNLLPAYLADRLRDDFTGMMTTRA
ncbi:hypothetical protein OZX62_05680 [Bifidobacterium sp. ESL0690]|uniref:hypothetical protein n=1 Tax=Bifidobacterium sp. ESL0690 TaxID=2983214 RepID=UPI0023F8371D|nr:hypothetical protein [Bifidobacterium sp. ESL0690]WEV45958.1 hypothetical protein OZX62_05680 [Bifidobacterium sp. ESL0690]